RSTMAALTAVLWPLAVVPPSARLARELGLKVGWQYPRAPLRSHQDPEVAAGAPTWPSPVDGDLAPALSASRQSRRRRARREGSSLRRAFAVSGEWRRRGREWTPRWSARK